MKLYKYRPLSDFLYKELFYQELYFASYSELNDPIDLSAKIEFTVEKEDQIEYLIWILFKTTLTVSQSISQSEKSNNKKLIDFNRNDTKRNAFKRSIYDKLVLLKKKKNSIWFEDIELLLADSIEETQIDFKFKFVEFKNELLRLTKKFLENSYTTCFSITNNNFLMWSHYASRHSGICLEFSLEDSGLFPYIMRSSRKPDHTNYLKRISDWEVSEHICWDKIEQVNYREEPHFINFFDFSPVFRNESDCDLIGLSKSWTHGFARELEMVFSTKTLPWKYENEWRAIEINFGEPKLPEERIRHYPIEALSGIYFGIRTPENIKKRIHNIFNKNGKPIILYDSKLTAGGEIDFEIWENSDRN